MRLSSVGSLPLAKNALHSPTSNDGISPLRPSILCDVFQNGVECCGILNKEEIYGLNQNFCVCHAVRDSRTEKIEHVSSVL